MDTVTRADGTAQTTLRTVPIELIDDDHNDMRRVAVSARSDAVLKGSILRHGVLQAIGVRQLGNRYQIAFGRRRLRLSRELERSEIPAMVGDWPDEAIRAVQVAENLHRAAPHEIDLWHSTHDMLEAGYSVDDAAEELGMDARQARLMAHLSKLHPDVLHLIEIEFPSDHHLRTIALATPQQQAKAVKSAKLKPNQVHWWPIVQGCQTTRIEKRVAIFDAAAHPGMWNEDLFAQPDDDTRFSTADVVGFMKLQRAALEKRVETERAAKKRVQLAEYDASKNRTELPKGFKEVANNLFGGMIRKPKRTECLFVSVHPSGSVVETLAVDVAAEKAATKEKSQRETEKARTAAATDTDIDTGAPPAGDAEADDAPLPETPQRSPISKAGLDLIAAAKTQALHDRLAWVAQELPVGELLRLVLVAFEANNIEIRDYQKRRAAEGIIARQVLPGGQLVEYNEAEARGAASKLLQALLTIGGPSERFAASGDAAEWIGGAIGAGAALPRFDTEALLATVNGETLRKVAAEAGIKASGNVAALRSKLIGALPNWRPDAAQFGAPGPVIEPDDDIEIETVPDDDAAE